MWTLSETIERLSDRLGEDSVTFWSDVDRVSYINDAQRLIASITRGVVDTASGVVNTTTPYVPLPTNTIDAHPNGAYVSPSGRTLGVISIEDANMVDPTWRYTTASLPNWLVFDAMEFRGYVTPVPTSDTTVVVAVAVLPEQLVAGIDSSAYLFKNVSVMEKYQPALLQLAATYALLKERYDGDAERYYQFFVQEMQSHGVNPAAIPSLKGVKQNANVDGS